MLTASVVPGNGLLTGLPIDNQRRTGIRHCAFGGRDNVGSGRNIVLECSLPAQGSSIDRRSSERVIARRETSEELLKRLIGERGLGALEEELGDALPSDAAAAAYVENLLAIRIEDLQSLPTLCIDN